MPYVFNGFNFSTLFLAGLGIFILLGLVKLGVKIAQSSINAESDEAWQRWTKINKRGCIIFRSGVAAILLSGSLLNFDHIPAQTAEIERQVEFSKLISIVERAAALQFTERCSFNGYTVDTSWIASDVFPCVTLGSTRMWKVGTAEIKKRQVNLANIFKVGIVQSDGAVAERLEVNFDKVDHVATGIRPATRSYLTPRETSALYVSMITEMAGLKSDKREDTP